MQTKRMRILSVLLFILIGLGLYSGIAEIVRAKTDDESDHIHSLYDLDRDSVDVIFLGSSHVYCSFQPNVLWHDYGITSYCMASPACYIPTSYYHAQEAILRQHPKVLVLECYMVWSEEKFDSDQRLHQAADPMRMGGPRLAMLRDFLADRTWEEKVEYYLPFTLYHSRWSELTDTDFHPASFLKGSTVRTDVYENEAPAPTVSQGEIPENVRTYVDKLVELCEKNDVELFVCLIPFGARYYEEAPTWSEDTLAQANALFAHLEELGVACANYPMTGELDIDWSEDFSDWTHLNYVGAEKVSHYIGGVLQAAYDLPDHRGEAAYASWDRDYEQYLSLLPQ